jgi:ArsR family transcriptional regulator
MDQRILSFSTGHRDDAPVRVAPSATLDLLYALHYLGRSERRPDDVAPWASDVRRRRPEVALAAAEAVARSERRAPLMAAFGVAIDEGYVADATPERFLADLPERARALHDARDEAAQAALSDELAAFVRGADPDAWSRELVELLGSLWQEVGAYWGEEGRPLAEAAAGEVERRLAEHGDVVRALPSHHFAQFEALAAKLRTQAARGPLFIVPLALASGGGFHLESSRAAALGFGLQAEDVHARTEAQVGHVARRAKALSDPTRLMLLSLLARYPTTQLTVGDLARQLGVSQPTVSGHLKTLREAGLVRVERQGNRSLPGLERDAVRELLDALDGVLHRPDLS